MEGPATYERPTVREGCLRLHFNENTSGCAASVHDAVQALSARDLAYYPDVLETTRASAERFGIASEEIVLTNGLDEGLLLSAVAATAMSREARREVLIAEPSYSLHRAFVEAIGADAVAAGPRADLRFPLGEVLDRITPRTALVFVTSPGNPTGEAVSLKALEAIADRLPDGSALFIDAAYADFGGEDPTPLAGAHPQVLVGRTFSKAYGLAGVRVGAVIGRGPLFDRLRQLVPPYTTNVVAATAVRAALRDLGPFERYCSEVPRSRELIYDVCERLGVESWPSAANFVLIRPGDRAAEILDALAARGVQVRDRSQVPGCAGCLRVTAGWTRETAAFVSALEDIW